MGIYKKLLWMLSACTLGLLASCDAGTQEALNVGTNRWPGYEFMYLARQQGYFEGNHIRMVELASATDVINAFEDGTLDAAALTLDEALTVAAHGLPIKIVCVLDISNGADALVSKPEIHQLNQLQHKRVGVEEGALGALMLEAVLNEAKLSPADITQVSVNVDRQFDEYVNGNVDAVITFEPVKTKLLRNGARVLFDSSMLHGEVIDVLVVRKDKILKHTRNIDALIKGHFRALQYFQDHQQLAAAKMALRLGIQPDELIHSYEGIKIPSRDENIKMFSGSPSLLEKNISHLSKILITIQQGILIPDLEYTDDSWLH